MSSHCYVCYSGGIINWSQTELHKLDIDTRKLITIQSGFSLNSDMDRLYFPQKKDGRRLISVKFAIELEQRSLFFCVHQSDDPYLRIASTNY